MKQIYIDEFFFINETFVDAPCPYNVIFIFDLIFEIEKVIDTFPLE